MSTDPKDYVLFHGHILQKSKDAIYSQWYKDPKPFVITNKLPYPNEHPLELLDNAYSPIHAQIQNHQFNCREQYMMLCKACLFPNNDNTISRILDESDPAAIKKLGRSVLNFDQTVWDQHAYQIVVNGNYLQFSQNQAMCDQLLYTGTKHIAEASPTDKIWGIGFAKTNALEHIPIWGQNLLGKALMEVRANLKKI